MPLDALTVSHALIRQLRGTCEQIALQDGDLARQLKRAATSVALNLAEGRQRAGRDRGHHYRIAAGSAAEVTAALDIAAGWAYIDAAERAALEAPLDRIRAMLWRLTHG
jgi:four helix bundle protein